MTFPNQSSHEDICSTFLKIVSCASQTTGIHTMYNDSFLEINICTTFMEVLSSLGTHLMQGQRFAIHRGFFFFK
jgi:hypothetical protein